MTDTVRHGRPGDRTPAGPAAPGRDAAPAGGLVGRLRAAYGSDRFRAGLAVFDILTVLAFVALAFAPAKPWTLAVEVGFGLLLLLELAARTLAAERRLLFLLRPSQLLDAAIVASLLLPAFTGSLAFLRILRALRLIRAMAVVRGLARRNRWVARRGELISTATDLTVFLLVTTAIVYEFQRGINPEITSMVDALYFTVSSLTTTGYGDITLVGDWGKLLSVGMMIAGVSLFVRLAQAVVRPAKVHCECQSCGLSRHDADAVHCKHCGAMMHIRHEGM